jgi:hypothetical protein
MRWLIKKEREMKSLFLTREQARALAEDLKEYHALKDSHDREIISSFEIRFGDLFAAEPQVGESLEVHPKVEYLQVDD